ELLRAADVEEFALDLDQVAVPVTVQLPITGQHDTAAVGVLAGQRRVTEHPQTTVGIHVEQLPRQPAVIRGTVHPRFIPTVQLKRVLATLLCRSERRALLQAGRGQAALRQLLLGLRKTDVLLRL